MGMSYRTLRAVYNVELGYEAHCGDWCLLLCGGMDEVNFMAAAWEQVEGDLEVQKLLVYPQNM